MKQLFIDAGTTYSKVLSFVNGKKEYKVIKTSELKNSLQAAELCTGHAAKCKNYENEAIALSFGTKYIENGTVLDLGSRDAKWVKFKNGKFKDMDWNTNCASATGATIEMLLKFYNVDYSALMPSNQKYPVTCGIFGLEKIMDDVSKGIKPEIAISKFITGVAFNAFNFTKRPDKIYLSGGFCENKCFVKALNQFTKVIPLGRFCLAEGLFNIYNSKQTNLN